MTQEWITEVKFRNNGEEWVVSWGSLELIVKLGTWDDLTGWQVWHGSSPDPVKVFTDQGTAIYFALSVLMAIEQMLSGEG